MLHTPSHDATQWNSSAVRKESLITNPSYTVPIGLSPTDIHVPEVIIISDVPLSTSGIRKIDYQIPALDRGVTNGSLKTAPFQKTIYDPLVWTDIELEKALKESFNDAITRGNLGALSSSGTRRFDGITKSSVAIQGYYDPRTFKITTFYFN